MKSAILVAGIDAQKFLQGQLTCDMNLLTASHPLRGAHCNLKGRVEALYDIFLKPEGVLLVTESSVIEQALEKLQTYARFSKVQLSIVPVDVEIQKQDSSLRDKKARLHPETLGRFLPQELELDQQGAVSFTKGCYLGQEVVARLHYIGKLKKSLEFTSFDYPVKPGETVNHSQWGEVEVVDVEGHDALVLKQV